MPNSAEIIILWFAESSNVYRSSLRDISPSGYNNNPMAGPRRNKMISQAEIEQLALIRYPDPRLRKPSSRVERIDDSLKRLVDKMFEVMFDARGVGLAAPQLGVNIRLFVASPTAERDDRCVYVNPEVISSHGSQEEEEGCLSLPGVSCKIKRPNVVTLRATNLSGQDFEETGERLLARIFRHEMDHIEGRLIVDRMGSVAKLANREALKQLEEMFA